MVGLDGLPLPAVSVVTLGESLTCALLQTLQPKDGDANNIWSTGQDSFRGGNELLLVNHLLDSLVHSRGLVKVCCFCRGTLEGREAKANITT